MSESAAQPVRKEAVAVPRCVCGHVKAHHAKVFVYDTPKCNWTGCGCPLYIEDVKESAPTHVQTERRRALTDAWQAVDRAIRPLGYGGGASNSPWNQGYEQAKNEALNAILALRDEATA